MLPALRCDPPSIRLRNTSIRITVITRYHPTPARMTRGGKRRRRGVGRKRRVVTGGANFQSNRDTKSPRVI